MWFVFLAGVWKLTPVQSQRTAAIVQVKGRVSEAMIYTHLGMEIAICYSSYVKTSLISINFTFLSFWKYIFTSIDFRLFESLSSFWFYEILSYEATTWKARYFHRVDFASFFSPSAINNKSSAGRLRALEGGQKPVKLSGTRSSFFFSIKCTVFLLHL